MSDHTKSNLNLNKNILKGDFDQLPITTSNEIRIFLSSTFKDYQAERNYLIQYVYNDLRKYCQETYQKDLILIDMRWGITDEAANQQITTQMCLNEIESCRQESVGPSFVTFLSYRYGGRFLNSFISEVEFELIKNKANVMPYKHITSLLEYCYELDENCLTNRMYKLKSVDSIINGLQINNDDWRVQEKNLINFIRKAVDTNFKNACFTKEQRKFYFNSVTEQEVQLGLFEEIDVNRKCLGFIREITNIQTTNKSKTLKAFIEEDHEVNELLEELKSEVQNKLSAENQFKFQIDWSQTNEFQEPYTDHVLQYLKTFGDSFQTSVRRLIDLNIDQLKSIKNGIFDPEIIHHAVFCKKLAEFFDINKQLKEKIINYIEDDSNYKPFIISGPTGSGKSTVVSHIAKQIKNSENIVMVRFMGTSRESSNIKSVFRSLIKHLNVLFTEQDLNKIEKLNYSEGIHDLKKKLIETLQSFSTNNKVIILLDSIDQLSPQDYSLEWMINKLPNNVKLICSVLSDYEGLEQKLKAKLSLNESNFFKIEDLTFNEAQKMFEATLKTRQRSLTETQMNSINQIFKNTKTIYPINVKLLIDISSKWSSGRPVPIEFLKCTTATDTAKYIFNENENLYGKVLFSKCMFYLTLFEYNGISESELEDILSIDDDVLTSVFQHHHPPVRRFPIALWLRIKNEIKDYLTNKEIDGTSVISWFHRTFIEASKEHYKNMFESSVEKDVILMNVIDYFTEAWNQMKSSGKQSQTKDFTYKKSKLNNFSQKVNGSITVYTAYRNTKSQKIKTEFNDGSNIIYSYNKRKLNELVNIISMLSDDVKKVELLKEHVYFDYEFMLAKAELYEMDFVIEMHKTILEIKTRVGESIEVDELLSVSEVYKNNYPKIQKNPSKNLMIEVLSRTESRSKFVEDFAKPSHLMLQKHFITEEKIKDMFYSDNSDLFINRMLIEFDGPFIYIQLENSNDLETVLYAINANTTKSIGSLQFKTEVENMQIVVDYPKNKDIKRLNDLNGYVYFTSYDTVYSTSLFNDIQIVEQMSNIVIGLVLLNSTSLLVALRTSIVLLNLKENKRELENKIEFDMGDDNEIQLSEYSISTDSVYSVEYLNSIDSVILLVGLSNKIIKIFRFSNKTRMLSLFIDINHVNWNFFDYGNWINETDYTWRKAVVIDKHLYKNNNQNNEILIKFIIQDDDILKYIKVYMNGQYVVDTIHSSVFEISTEELNKIELEAIYNNRAILKLLVSPSKWNVYVYDLGEKRQINLKNVPTGEVVWIENTELLVAQNEHHWELYEFDENRILNIMKLNYKQMVQTLYQGKNIDWKMKDNKLLRIDPEKRLSIQEIEYRLDIKPESTKITVLWILTVFNDKHILVEIKRDVAQVELAVFDIITQTILNSLIISTETKYVKVLQSNKDNLVILNQKDFLIYFYKIQYFNDQYKFSEAIKISLAEEIAKQWSWNKNRCCFDDSDKCLLAIYDPKLNVLNVRILTIKCFVNNEQTQTYEDTLSIDLNQFELDPKESSTLISGNNKYLVLWQSNKKTLYFIDLLVELKVNKIELDDEINYIRSLINTQKSNELIIKGSKSFIYVELNEKQTNTFKIKDQLIENNFDVSVAQNLLLLDSYDNEYIEIYKVDVLRQNMKVNSTILKKKMKLFCANDSYLIVACYNYDLCIYKLETMQELTCINLNNEIKDLKCSKDYISLIICNQDNELFFLSFKLTQ